MIHAYANAYSMRHIYRTHVVVSVTHTVNVCARGSSLSLLLFLAAALPQSRIQYVLVREDHLYRCCSFFACMRTHSSMRHKLHVCGYELCVQLRNTYSQVSSYGTRIRKCVCVCLSLSAVVKLVKQDTGMRTATEHLFASVYACESCVCVCVSVRRHRHVSVY